MIEFTQPNGTLERIEVLHGDPAVTQTIFRGRDRAGLVFIRALCRTPPEVDVGAFVRGDFRTFGYSVGALALERVKNRIFKKRARL